jgi:hypothetical protein
MIEPMIATRKLQALKPVTPTPPAASKMKPPTASQAAPIGGGRRYGRGGDRHDCESLVVRDAQGRLSLTASGRAVLRAMLPEL